MSIRNLLYIGLFVFSLSACSQDLFLKHNGNLPSADKISRITKGQSREEVRQILGTPSSITSFEDESWLYMSSTMKQVAFFQPKEIDREILKISFNPQGEVSSISNYSQKDGINCEIDPNETDSAGHDIGFFRKYFGGVGAFIPIAPNNTGDF